MIEQIKPRRLERGHRIGIVSPSYWMDDAQWVCAQTLFEQRGYELVPGQTQGLRDFRYAGSPEQRARDIMAMFRDPTIDAIICARGGYGVNRVLPLLDFEDIRSHPKIFVGYSDITALLLSFAQNCGLTAFHGPMLSSCGRPCDEYNFQTLEAVLSGRSDIRIAGTPGCRPRVLRAGKATGQLWGGNLSLIIERLGTRDQIDARGRILFIEEIGEKLHAFDRMLLHLRACGKFDQVAGLIVGELVEMDEGETPFGKSTDDIVLDVFGDLDIPIVSNFPCGHGHCQATIPVAHEAELRAEADEAWIHLPTSPVT